MEKIETEENGERDEKKKREGAKNDKDIEI